MVFTNGWQDLCEERRYVGKTHYFHLNLDLHESRIWTHIRHFGE